MTSGGPSEDSGVAVSLDVGQVDATGGVTSGPLTLRSPDSVSQG